MTQNPGFLAKRYRYADGGVYNQNRYDIYDAREPMPAYRYYPKIGGALVTKSGKAIAYFSGDNPVDGSKVKYIEHDAEWYVWGDNLPDALNKFRERMLAAVPFKPVYGVFWNPDRTYWYNVSTDIVTNIVALFAPDDDYKAMTPTEWTKFKNDRESAGWTLEGNKKP